VPVDFSCMVRSAVCLLAFTLACASTAPANDADLAVDASPVADAEYGYARLGAAVAALSLSEADRSALRTLAAGATWDFATATRLTAANEEALARLADAVAAPYLHAPPDDYGFPGWIDLAGLCELRALLRARTGDRSGALADVRLAQGLGRAFLRDPSGGALWQAMIGISIELRSYRAWARILPELRPTPAESRALARELAGPVDAELWRRVWATEYQHAKRSFAESGVGDPRALELLAGQTRAIQQWAGRPCADWLSTADGKRVLLLWDVSFDRFELRRCLVESASAAAQAQLGLRAYQLEHGHLPERLADLVPHYLDAVPIDGFDGAPLRYDREQRVLESVGSDLEPGLRAGSTEDPSLIAVFPIRF
jgi:hypothetical protein